MFSVADIMRRDAATYYNYNDEKRHSRARTMGTFALGSVVVGFLIEQASNEFLGGTVSAQAILVGFSFNVLFYLVANRLTRPAKFASIEHELRFERLSKLSDEVFDNVTYFNLVAISSALIALLLLLLGSKNFNLNAHKISIFLQAHIHLSAAVLSWGKWAFLATCLSVLLFLLTESVFTFLRAVGRVRFYFSMLKTMDDDATSANDAG